jgi:hypothetical protein
VKTALAIVGTAVSAALLLRSLRKGRAPAVVRQVFDAARSVLQLAAVVAVVVITGVRSPLPLLLIAVGVGLAAGSFIGSTLQLELREQRIFARRSIIGATVWGTGLVVAQLAGIADRTGAFRVGQAISWFGLAVAIGTFAGRSPRLGELRQRIALGTVAGGALLVALAAAAYPPPTTTAAAGAPAGTGESRWVLDEVVTGAMDGFTTFAHTPGSITAEINVDGYKATFTASYEPLPAAELFQGDQVEIEVTANATVQGTVQQYSTLDVIQIGIDGWTGAAVGVNVSCTDPIGEEPLYCTGPDSNQGTFTWEVPAAGSGSQFAIGIGVLNCSCEIVWVYEPTTAPQTDNSTGGDPGGDPGGDTPIAPADSDTDSEAVADDEEISEDEALGSAIAVVLISILIGLIDVAEIPPGPSAPPKSRTLPPPPPDPAYIDAMADQADQWALDAVIAGIPYEAITDQIREIRERAKLGQSQPGDAELLRAIRDALWAIGVRERAGTAATEEQNAAVLGALETVMGIEIEFLKASAGTLGPATATLYAGVIETIANRDKGLAKALGHGAVAGGSALVGSRAAPAMENLRGAMGILRAGGRNAAESAAEDIGHQLVDSGGDVTKIDPTRTAGSAATGFVAGAGARAMTPMFDGDVPTPPRSGDLPTPAPRPRTGDLAPPRGADLPPPRPAGPPTPPRLDNDPAYRPPPPVDTTPAPVDVYEPPTRPVSSGLPQTDMAPTDMFPDSPELPPRIRLHQDAAGNFLDPGGNPLYRMTPQGPQDMDGNQISRIIFDGKQRPIGYELADGTQVIGNAEYDPGAFGTVSGPAAPPIDPDALPPTGQQPRR